MLEELESAIKSFKYYTAADIDDIYPEFAKQFGAKVQWLCNFYSRYIMENQNCKNFSRKQNCSHSKNWKKSHTSRELQTYSYIKLVTYF